MEDMTTKMQQLDRAFSRLEKNRKNVPLEQLQTRYAAGYKALTDEIRQLSEWYADASIQALAIPTDPRDTGGNAWLEKKVARIREEERCPGGLYDQIREALIETLDWNALGNTAYKLLRRIEVEAWEPYQRRYQGMRKGRIYSALFRGYWTPDPELPEGGAWRDENGKIRMMGYPPRRKAS